MLHILITSGQNSIHPNLAIYKKNEDYLFSCGSYHGTTPKWFFNHKTITQKNVIIIEDYVYIHKATSDNIGFYECVGNTNQNTGYFSATSILKPRGKLRAFEKMEM